MKSCIQATTLVLCASFALGAAAERKFYYYDSGNGFNTAVNYRDPMGTKLSTFDTAGDYWLKGDTSMRTVASSAQKTFKGAEFNIGSPSATPEGWRSEWGTWWGKTSGTLQSFNGDAPGSVGPFTVDNLVWWNGTLYAGTQYPGVSYQFFGRYTLRQADTGVEHTSYTVKDRPSVTFGATILSSVDDQNSTDAVWTICENNEATSSLANLDAGTNFLWRMTGDHSGYKGRLRVTAPFQPLVVYNEKVLGDVSVTDAAALELGTDAAVAFAADFVQNAARGIRLTGDRAYLATWSTLANEYTVRYPISKASDAEGALVKRGPGTVTLDGAYTAGSLTVHEGKLVIGRNATFPVGTPICVEAGAKLESYLPLSTFQFSGKGEWKRVLETLTIPFDQTAGGDKTVPAVVSAVDMDLVQPIMLSTPVVLPQHESMKLPVVRYTGSQAITAEMFSDATSKNCGLPKTNFSIEPATDGKGGQIVYMNVRAVVVSKKLFGSSSSVGSVGGYVTFNGIEGEDYWSDSRAAHDDADYLLTNGVNKISNNDFSGGSLTIGQTAEDQSLLIRANGTLPDAVIYPKTLVTPNNTGSESYSIGGSVSLTGGFGEAYTLNLENKYNDGKGQVVYKATLSGAGTFWMSQNKKVNEESPEAYIQLTGDNSEFLGKMMATGNGPLRIRINDAKNLGGALDEFHDDALQIGEQAFLKPLATMVLSNDVNRGIYVPSEAGFDVPENVTLTCLRPIKVGQDLVKRGAGTLLLGGDLTLAEGATGLMTILEPSAIGALSDSAVAGLTLTATNDITIVVSPESTAKNGFTGLVLSGGSDRKVHVRFDATKAEKGEVYKLPICTVDNASGITADTFVIDPVCGYPGRIVAETVGDNTTRYSFKCPRLGLVITFK